MALEHALLLSLEEHSGSGYELTRRFENSIGFFWKASHQQIYRTLKRMVEHGWVRCDEIAQHGRPDKKLYAVSDGGRAELQRWLAEPGDPVTVRHELALKVRGASLGDLDAVIDDVVRHRDRHAERLELYRAIEQRDFPDSEQLGGQALHHHLVLRGGIRLEDSLVAWCDEMLEALRHDRPETSGESPER